jgi:N-acetylglucosamine-6-phosphate deacetylase
MTTISAERIFDGERWHDRATLIFSDGKIAGIAPAEGDVLPGFIAPGFVDLQVNGGGGALFNESPTVETIRTMCATYARFGTTGLLPTLITDTPEVTKRAIAAGIAAKGTPGFLGLHLEGPHLSIARKGAHDPALIRKMTDADLAALVTAARELPHLLTTVAVESVSRGQIAELTAAGITVSIGHSDATYAQAKAAAVAGATMATHLFNAMSQLGNREPGLVGAALDEGRFHAGLIADGIHVDPATIGIAMRAKRGPGRIVLITDAMSVTGTDEQTFTLNGRTIHRQSGALRLADGTLAGADLTMIGAAKFMAGLGYDLDEVLRMASVYPAAIIGRDAGLTAGAPADFVHLSSDLTVTSTWIAGTRVFG